jgi:imidazolonepropionase-like amidohydrolase
MTMPDEIFSCRSFERCWACPASFISSFHPTAHMTSSFMLSTSRLVAAAALLAVTAFFALPAQAQLAVRADTVYTMTGAPIVDGVVLVRGSTIEAVGPASEVSIPEGVRTLTATVVTPGLIDPHGTVGTSGIYNVDADQDQLDTSMPMQPELRAIDAYNPREELVAFVRGLGVTTVHTGHGPGAPISGQTAVFSTHGDTVEEALRDSLTTVAMTVGPAAGEAFESPGTRAKGIAMLRERFVAARAYAAKKEAGEDVEVDLGMEVLMQVLAGDVPAMITAHKAHDLQAALRLQEEFGFRLLLAGAAESYLIADQIRDAGVPVLLHATMIRPSGGAESAAFTTAATLHEAGIPVAIQSGYEAYVPKSRIVLYEAAVAAAYGLPRDAALASITRTAAEILGLDDRIGTLAPGMDADLALFDGDPLETTTRVCHVIARGQVVSDECR